MFVMLENVKLRLGIADNDSDAIINVYIEQVRQTIVAYCNLLDDITTIPPEINDVVASMTVDIIRAEQSGNLELISLSQPKYDIKLGDATVKDNTVNDSVVRGPANKYDKYLTSYYMRLLPYRELIIL